jgi:predicted metal-dependent hydrolase
MDLTSKLVVRRSLRAKRLRIVIRPDRVELVVPHGVPERLAHQFLQENQEWVIAKFKLAQQRSAEIPINVPLLSDEGQIPFQGMDCQVRLVEITGRIMRARLLDEGGFEFRAPLTALQSETVVKSALFRVVRPWLEREIQRYIDVLGVPDGLIPREIRIKRMRSRWGSCGPRGDINLNWILAFMPPEMLEYVVYHELCHLKHRNHSDSFWSLVETRIPDWRQRRAWLKQEGGLWVARFS